MKKTVIVVEGQTEQIFTHKLIEKLVLTLHYHIQLQKLHGGVEIEIGLRGTPTEHATHHIRIINVEGDDQVNTYIEDRLDAFIKKDFKIIYGLRDRFTRDKKKPKLNVEAINDRCKQLEVKHAITLEIIVAIEEIEAWFMSVPEFFTSYSNSLTLAKINEILGYDLSTINVESLSHPSQTIHEILTTVNQTYKKRLDEVHKIASVLNYDSLYLEKTNSIQPLKKFVGAVENCLS